MAGWSREQALSCGLLLALLVPCAQGAVGRTAGSFQVTSTGAATYSIPLFTPPAPGAVQPSVALVYNSNAGVGYLGRGWGLSGSLSSSISRCNRSIAQDGHPGAAHMHSNAAFCLDGNRLRLQSGTYGKNGSVWATEVADFSRVTANAPTGQDVYGPISWTVERKDGTTWTYGGTADSRAAYQVSGHTTVLKWMVSEIRDRAGNKVRFEWNGGVASHPLKIEWTQTAASSGSYVYSMEFSYGGNVPASTRAGFFAELPFLDDQLLNAITVKASGTVVRKYALTYETSPTSGAKRLTEVKECADSGATDCLAPTSISYQNGASGVDIANPALSLTGSITAADGSYDFDGDGFKDIAYRLSGTWYVRFGSSSGTYSAAVSTGLSSFQAGRLLGNHADQLLAASGGTWYVYAWNGASFTPTSTGLTTAQSAAQVVVADMDGDGRDDLLYQTSVSWQTWDFGYFPTINVALRRNTSTGTTPSFSSPIVGSWEYQGEYFPGFSAGNNTPGDAYEYFPEPPTPYLGWAISPTSIALTKGGDMDGDGSQEVNMTVEWESCGYFYGYGSFPPPDCVIGGPSGQLSTALRFSSSIYDAGWVGGNYTFPVNVLNTLTSEDFNGDNCDDYLHFDPMYGNAAALSDCSGGIGAILPSIWYGENVGSADWTGDGRPDYFQADGSTLYVRAVLGGELASPVNTGIPSGGSCIVVRTDGNGDGLDDIGCLIPGSSLTIYLHNAAATTPDLLAHVVDGFGVTHSPTYTTIERGNYSAYSNAAYPYRDITSGRRVVGQVQASDGIGGTFTTTYHYFGAAANVQGRGFSGFDKIEKVDARSGLKHVQEFKREFPDTGMLAVASVHQPNGYGGWMPVSSRTTTSAGHVLSSTPFNERVFPYLSGITEDVYEVGGPSNGNWIARTEVTNTYDTWGNLTASTKVTTDHDSASSAYGLYGHSWTESMTASIWADTGANWCLGLPTYTSVTQSTTTGEASVQRVKTFTPDYANCRMASDILEPYDYPRRVESTYGYDAFGNVASVAVKGYNPNSSAMTTRTSTIGWGATGQFPLSETNALSQTTNRTFHPTFGSLVTETDPNGIVVANNAYDTFGRLSTETHPDGTFATYAYGLLSPSVHNPLGTDYVLRTSYDSGSSVIRYDYTFRDQLGRMINEYHSTPGGGYSTAARSYDALGRVASEGMPFWTSGGDYYTPPHAATYTYDLLGRVIAQSRPQSQSVSTPVTTTFTYAGRVQTITDPHSKSSTKVLDVNGWMRRSTDHDGYYQSFGYDAAGSLKQVTDSLSNTLFTADYSYGLQAFQTATTDMDLGSWGYTYNSLGELVSWTDAKSQSFSQTYDALSRVTSRTEPEGTTTWTWGASSGSKNIGRLASVSMTGYAESFTYDSLGRPSTQTLTTDQSYAIDYAYNNQGLLDTLTYPTSTSSTRVKVKYGYQYGLLNTVTDWTSGSAGTVYWTANTQNVRGQTTQETLGNGVVTQRSFDAVTGWLNSIQSGLSGGNGLQNQSYLYDLVGNVTQRQENTLGLTENFHYDNLYRLDYSQLNSTTNLDLTYDAMGNITARSDVNGNATWTYHGTKKHAVATTGTGGVSFSYDANGNMTSRAGSTITWSSFNYPTALATATETAEFYYGPNRQYYKQVYNGSSVTETTHYVGGILEKVFDGTSYDWRHYIKAGGQTVAIVSRSSAGPNAVHYPLEDNQGSGSALVDSAGTGYVRQSYTAFGLPRDGSDWDGAVPSGDQAAINAISRRGYTGHSMLGDMGLIHMNGRVQDAITGRFLSPDPYVQNPGFTQSFNRFAYVNNNPLSYIDPSGFCTDEQVDSGDPECWLDEVLATGRKDDPCGPYGFYDFQVVDSVPQSTCLSWREAIARIFNNFGISGRSGSSGSALTPAKPVDPVRQREVKPVPQTEIPCKAGTRCHVYTFPACLKSAASDLQQAYRDARSTAFRRMASNSYKAEELYAIFRSNSNGTLRAFFETGWNNGGEIHLNRIGHALQLSGHIHNNPVGTVTYSFPLKIGVVRAGASDEDKLASRDFPSATFVLHENDGGSWRDVCY